MNSDLAYATLGPCEDYEFELVDLVDGALTLERGAVVQRHVDGCARCRAFVQEFRAIDTSLAGALPRVELSPEFDARLHERIGQLARAVPKGAVLAAEEDEYRSMLRELRRGFTWRTTLNAMATAAVGGALAYALGSAAPALLQSAGAPSLALGLSVAGVAVACGVAAPAFLRRSSAFG